MNPIHKNQSGQSTVEFALSLMMLLGFVFFMLQLALVLGWGNYVQYATFMAARAYQSGGVDPEEHRQRARRVIVQTLKASEGAAGRNRFPLLGMGVGGADPEGAEIGTGKQFQESVRDLSWQEGVRYTFRSKLFLLPMVGATEKANSIVLTSESWLGRETSYGECLGFLSSQGNDKWLIDNGC